MNKHYYVVFSDTVIFRTYADSPEHAVGMGAKHFPIDTVVEVREYSSWREYGHGGKSIGTSTHTITVHHD